MNQSMSLRENEPFAPIQWLARRTRRQITFVIALVAVYELVQVARWGAGVELDRWWLRSVTSANVWAVRTRAQLLLAVVSGVISLAIMLPLFVSAQRVKAPDGQKTFRPIALVKNRLGPAMTWIAWAVPFYFTFRIIGASVSHWKEWVLYANSVPTGVEAPQVGHDIAYHLFSLPLFSTTAAWLSSVLIVTFFWCWGLMVLNGAIRLPIAGRKTSPKAIQILTVIGAMYFLVQAGTYWFVRYPNLGNSKLGLFDGAGWAEMHSKGIAFRPLAIGCLLAAILLVLALTKTVGYRWGLAAVAAVAIVQIAGAVLLPIFLQRFIVRPTEAIREQPYVAQNLQATRDAYGLEQLQINELTVSPSPTVVPDVSRVPKFEQTTLAWPFQILQGRRATRIVDVDLDRYTIDGVERPVFVGVRNADRAELPEKSWVHEHLVYTHGSGAVAAYADQTTPTGAIPFDGLQDRLGPADHEIYFGDNLDDWWVLTGTKRAEANGVRFGATTGVPITSRWQQVVAGVGLNDINVAVSGELTDQTQLLMRRTMYDRMFGVAPFLTLDSDPYAVITDQGVVWMADAYVTSNTYPYSQVPDLTGTPDYAPLRSQPADYIRHAAVLTMDAYSGEFHLYRSNDRTEVLDAWDRAFPGLFQPLAELPAELAAHRRYPTDLFALQSSMIGRYHVDNAQALFNGDDAWMIASDVQKSDATDFAPARPVWQFVDQLGGDWSTTRPLSPGLITNPASQRNELAAFAIGDHESGVLTILRLQSSDAGQLPSPTVAQSIIASDPDISQLLTLLNANGSNVIFGPSTPLIENGGLSWYRTLVVSSTARVSTPRMFSDMVISNNGVKVLNETKSSDDVSLPNQPAEPSDNGTASDGTGSDGTGSGDPPATTDGG